MGEDTFKGDLFFINNETEETGKIGKIGEIEVDAPEIAPGGIIEGKTEFVDVGEFKGTISIPVRIKTITKKRAIKLMMGWGYQKNEAYNIHRLYMKTHKTRTQLGLRLFCMMFR